LEQQKNKSPLRQAITEQRQSLFRNGRYWFHILIWAIAFGYLAFSDFGHFNVGVTKGVTINTKSGPGVTPIFEYSYLYISLLSICTAAIMVYSYLLLFIPYAKLKKKKLYLWIGLLSNIAFWFVTITITVFIIGYKSNFDKPIDKHDIFVSVMISSFFSGVIAGYFFALYYFIDLYDQQKNLKIYKQALTGRLEAESAFLLNQINPHFLFNTLNNIYSLLLSHSDDAIFAAKELQNLMQYVLRESSHDKVPLSGEIDFLKSYISLEKLRNQKDQISIQFVVTGNPEGKTIPPLLLISFLENAFKHGVKAGFSESYIHVKIEIRKDTLILEMENSKPPLLEIPDQSIIHEGGIGIKNVQRRLDILYPNRYKLSLQNTPNQFLVLLSIDLQQQ
jgi:sensor histidine kinase YesM